MAARWRGSDRLRRVSGDDVRPGEAFDPTDAERAAFGDLIEAADACDVVKTDGEVCGRELPCRYHSEDT